MSKAVFNAVQVRIARPTNNLEAVVRFYKEGLGLKELGSFKDHDGYDGVMLGLPDAAIISNLPSIKKSSCCRSLQRKIYWFCILILLKNMKEL